MTKEERSQVRAELRNAFVQWHFLTDVGLRNEAAKLGLHIHEGMSRTTMLGLLVDAFVARMI